MLLDLLDPKIWRTNPPSSKRRNIATTFAHIHNVRCMRLKMSLVANDDLSARDTPPPARLDRAKATPDEAREALAASARAMATLLLFRQVWQPPFCVGSPEPASAPPHAVEAACVLAGSCAELSAWKWF